MTLSDLALLMLVICPVLLIVVGIWAGWFA